MDWVVEAVVTAGGLMAALGAGAVVMLRRHELGTAASEGGDALVAARVTEGAAVGPFIDPASYSPERADACPLVSRKPLSLVVKRSADLVLAILLLAFTMPLLVGSAIAIKFDSKGPVFYRQRRLGRDGKTFSIIKFRTMVTDAEAAGPRWADKGDDRITKVGRFLRKTRIDEIPQALNILTGDMSFVGPRPERPEFTDELEAEIPNFRTRTLVKPGLTGWAQVNLPYAASIEDVRTKLAYDLYYIDNYSLRFDVLIVLKTVGVALFSDSAH